MFWEGKIDQALARLTKSLKELKIKNEKRNTTIITTDPQRIFSGHYEQLYTNHMESVESSECLDAVNLPILNHEDRKPEQTSAKWR